MMKKFMKRSKTAQRQYKFQYKRLPDSTPDHKFTRLLKVLPRIDNDQLTCEMCPIDLSANDQNHRVHNRKRFLSHRTTYTALSYVWGESNNTTTVQILSSGADGGSSGSFEVRQNLYKFLLEVRRRDDHTWLWIDAICINQESRKEKSQQVAQMGDVYRMANEVIIWLGDSSHISDLFSVINERHDDIHEDLNAEEAGELHLSLSYLRCPANTAIETFFHNQYWLRTWIRQEFALANSAMFWAAGQSLQMALFELFIDYHSSFEPVKPGSQINHSPVLNVLDCRRNYQNSKIREVGQLPGLRQFWSSKTDCADARDRIYAVLSLANSVYQSFPVDYTRSKYDVFCQACMFLKDDDRSGLTCAELLEMLQIEPESIRNQLREGYALACATVDISGAEVFVSSFGAYMASRDDGPDSKSAVITQIEEFISKSKLTTRSDELIAIDNFLDKVVLARRVGLTDRGSIMYEGLGWLIRREPLRMHGFYGVRDDHVDSAVNQSLHLQINVPYKALQQMTQITNTKPEEISNLFSEFEEGHDTFGHGLVDLHFAHWTFARFLNTKTFWKFHDIANLRVNVPE